MTDVLDPLVAARRIAGDYTRYLRSSFAPRDPELRAAFDAQLGDGRQLTKGPILQAVPPYATGSSVDDLIAEGVLSPHLRALANASFGTDRPLYVHQEQAVRKLGAHRNLVVATGTGSGKTEAFLLPILDGLVRERDAGTLTSPGVRALLLYPMNALANDQLARLRDLLTPFPDVTFGRYVGDTPNAPQAALDQFRVRFGGEPASNELLSRQAMKERPPHILLTNFAMLEYLLLRPEDQRLFDGDTGRHWRFVVLDEVHVYDGAKGAEIGMLLRRVRERVVDGHRGRLTFVGTSATLGKGAEDIPRLVDFANELFDEELTWDPGDATRQDVVEATREALVLDRATWDVGDADLVELRDAFRSGATAGELAALVGPSAPAPASSEPADQWLGRAFGQERHVIAMQELLGTGSVDIVTAAGRVFPNHPDDAAAQLAALVDLCVSAAAGSSDRPLLPARWHFLLRSLEGAYACLSPDHPSSEPRLVLSRHQRCPGCASQGRESAMFETAVCRRCGAQHIVGEESQGLPRTLQPPRPVTDRPRTFLVTDEVVEPDDDEDEAAIEEDEEPGAPSDPAVICTRCGAVDRKKPGCGCAAPSRRLQEVRPASEGAPIRRCLACGGRTSGGSLIQRFLTGSDAPVAVIATSLYQELPPVQRSRGAVGDGRKLLSFADSRQDAAFFAPYLERTYNRAVQRRLLWEVMSERVADGDTVLTMADLRTELKNRAIDAGVIDEHDDEHPADQQARHWLYAEILSTDRQQNLEGVGLAEITPPIPRGLAAPAPLLDLGLESDEVFDLMRVLLDSVRRARAVTVDSRVNLDDPIFEGRPVTSLRGDDSAPKIISWNPSRGTNQRVKYLRKVLDRLGRTDVDPKALLATIWTEWLADPHGDWGDVLVTDDLGKGRGLVRRLKSERLELRPVTDDHQPLRCDRCRLLWWRSVRGACPGVSCDGTVGPIDEPLERDHYRELYTSLRPIGLRVEEHTAQLSTNVAAARQQAFLEGTINALSCSTTFELGVDVGEIQAVLMRNVPPTAANYVQRAGRAGRRAGSPALVVTFAQRRSHDLHFFDHPHSMVDGQVSAPIVSVDNPAIVRRHLNALAFAEFQKQQPQRPEGVNHTVEDFFMPVPGSPSDQMVSWLRSHPAGIAQRLRTIVPPTLADHPDIDLDGWGWLEGLDGDPNVEGCGRLRIAATEVRGELTDIADQIADAYAERQGRKAVALESVHKTVASVRTLDRLARSGVLPKYGFPVDVVTLALRNETGVELDRDLAVAIADFAPGNEIVADKRVWHSTGLRVPTGMTLLVQRWTTCGECEARWTWLEDRGESPPCPGCGAEANKHGQRLTQPRFGFVGEDTGKRPGDSRPPRRAFTSSFFDDYVGGEPERAEIVLGRRPVEVAASRSGRITVVNQGPHGGGYELCRWCGFIQVAGTGEEDHPRPTGRGRCQGQLVRSGLGHWYLTDTVQIIPKIAMDSLAANSALQALLAATEDVGVAHNDVNGALHPSSVGEWSFVLFDAVPGGAGHARHLRDVLPDLFTAARARVEHCDCGLETSCYGCLRSFRNQRDHDRLQRRLALQVFDELGVA